VKCWVDEDVERGVTVIGYWKEIVNIGRYVLLFLTLIPPSPLDSPFLPVHPLNLVTSLGLSSNQGKYKDKENWVEELEADE
jgi:hypothetical protein